MNSNSKPPRLGSRRLGQSLRVGGSAMLAACALGQVQAHAQGAAGLASENEALRKRVEALENLAKKEGILSSGESKPASVAALSEITLSGFVQSSYFYNTRKPADGYSDGYLWNTKDNSFSINKVKVVLASPAAERSGEKWDAGFRTSFIWGEDAPVLNTGSGNPGLEALREAFIDINAPIGDGLNIKAGQLISLLNYESGDGGAANGNFSQGYQWFFTGNGPAPGVQAGYVVNDWLDLTMRVQNGLYGGPLDGNSSKTMIGRIGLKPSKDLWIALLGFGGSESAIGADVTGGSILAGYQVTEQLGLGFEGDYFQFDSGTTSDLYSVGSWISYDFTSKVGLAFRGEYLHDPDGGGLKGIGLPNRPGSGITSLDPDGDLGSLTLTLNWKPAANLKIQPEVRWDGTSYAGGLDGHKSRVIVGAGVTYMF